jgi:hypothetical protein
MFWWNQLPESVADSKTEDFKARLRALLLRRVNTDAMDKNPPIMPDPVRKRSVEHPSDPF